MTPGDLSDAARTELEQALAHHERGETAAAESLYRAILTRAPRHADALHLFGVLRYGQGRHDAAADLIARAIEASPGHAGAHSSLGIVLMKLGRFEEALASFDRVVALAPQDAEGFYHRANALRSLGRHDEALADYFRAVARKSDHAEALYNRGNTLRDLGRDDEAVVSYDLALAAKPHWAEALNNRGNALLTLKRYDEALASYERALALNRAYPEAWSNRGNALRDLNRCEEALASYDRALALKPHYAEALGNRANVLRELKRYADAAQAFQQLMVLAPTRSYAAGERLGCRLMYCAWENYERDKREITEAVARGEEAALPFSLFTITDSAPSQLQCARTYIADRYPPVSPPLWAGEIYRHDRIRLAYLSASFHNHSQASLIAGLFEAHDTNRFDVTAISLGPEVDDEMGRRLRRSCEHFVPAAVMSDSEVARMLRSREINIAVDLKGFSQGCRPGIFAYRAAPVQVAHLGYPATTGADYIDYLLADRHVVPAEHEAFYAEKIVRLPDSYQVNDTTRPLPDRVPSRAEAALPDTGFVFCCFNNNYKIAPYVFDVWMRLLARVEGSVLWLLEDNPDAALNLRREAARRGVSPARVLFAPRQPRTSHLARHRLADLFLDTLPCNAHVTGSDALWIGVPIVTCAGDSFAARVGASLLHAIGLPELVTPSLKEYEALAFKLATTPRLLADVRTRLARNLRTHALFDIDRYRRHFEDACVTMWMRYQRGQPPAAFAVPLIT